jgi:hypothetical protein
MSAYQRRLSAQTRQKILMLEPNDFFQNQAKQCYLEADRAANKNDREFWLQLARRWEKLSLVSGSIITAEQQDSDPRPKFRKNPFAKRRPPSLKHFGPLSTIGTVASAIRRSPSRLFGGKSPARGVRGWRLKFP